MKKYVVLFVFPCMDWLTGQQMSCNCRIARRSLLSIFVFLFALYILMSSLSMQKTAQSKDEGPSTVLSYVMFVPRGRKDREYEQCVDNFNFFLIRGGLTQLTDTNVVFSLVDNTTAPRQLLKLADSREFIRIRRARFAETDLHAHVVVVRRYYNVARFFMMLNCGARGPYFQETSMLTWLDIFKGELDSDVQLVGPTISCEIQPHIQSYAMMTGKEGARVLIRLWSRLSNMTRLEMIARGEVAFSTTLLNAGWRIRSLELRKDRFQTLGLGSPCDPEFHGLANSLLANPTTCRVENSPGCEGLEPCEMLFVKYGGTALKYDMIAAYTRDRIRAEESSMLMCSQERLPRRPYVHEDDIPHSNLLDEHYKVIVIVRAHKLYTNQLLSMIYSIEASNVTNVLALVTSMDCESWLDLKVAVGKLSGLKNVGVQVIDVPREVYEKHEKTMEQRLCTSLRVRELRRIGYIDEHINRFCGINSPLHYVLTDIAVKFALRFRYGEWLLVTNADNSYSPAFFRILLENSNSVYDVVTTNTIVKGGVLVVRPQKGYIDLGSFSVSSRFLRDSGITFLSSLPVRPRADHYHDADGHFFVNIFSRNPRILNVSAFLFYQI